MATSLTINGVALNFKDWRSSLIVVAAEWDDWENAAYIKDWQQYGTLQRWTFRCSEQWTAWSSSHLKAMEDAAKAGAAVNCVFIFDGETIVNENVYIVSVASRYAPAFDATKIREFEVEVREVS